MQGNERGPSVKNSTIVGIAIGCGALLLLAIAAVVVAAVLLGLLWVRASDTCSAPAPPAVLERPEFAAPEPAERPSDLAPVERPALPAPAAPPLAAPCPPASAPLGPPEPPAKTPPAAPAAAPGDAAKWVQHADPLGFAVQHPPGWTVEATREGLIVVRSADRASAAVVLPFFARGAAAQQCLAQSPGVLGSVLPQVRITKAVQKSLTPDVALASMECLAGAGRGRGAMLASVFDRGGMLFALAAPADRYAAERPVLVRILQSFRFTKAAGAPQAGGAAGAGADAAVRYVPWQDPNEKAFSLEVPEGWKVTGGLVRRNAVDPRGCIQIASPDGEVVVSSGDATVPTFSLPGFSQFFPEGSDYSPGYGVVMKVMRYKTGAQFAAEYVQTRVGQTIGGIVITGSRDRPDVAQVFNDIYRRFNSPMVSTQLSMGEVAFTGRYQDKAAEGYWFAGTQLTATNMGDVQGGIWTVPHLVGYVATPAKAPLAQAVMMHLVLTSRLNPEWAAMQQGLTANVSEIVTETNKALSNTIVKGYEGRQPAQDNASRNWSNMMLGQTDLVDPDTGQTYKAASGHNYYWVRPGSNTGFGTSTSDPPDINVAPLVEW